MADTKISGLTADATPTSDDLLVTVNDPGGTPANRKVTISALLDFIEANGAAAASFLSSGTLADARVAESNVTQHEAALSITESQISDLGTYQVQLSEGAFVDGDKTLLDAALQPGDNATELDGTAHRLFYTDGSGDVQELGFGTPGQVLKSNGAASAPAFQNETAGSGGDVDGGDAATQGDSIQVRRDSAADFTSNDPTLDAGEIGYETDTGQFKIGDGSTAWTSLDYVSVGAASVSQTNTGTATNLSVTPDGLAGSYAGTKTAVIECFSFSEAEDVSTGNGAGYFLVPPEMDGMNLVGVYASHLTAGTGAGTDDTDIMVHNLTDTSDMLSAAASIREDELSTEAANGSNGTIDTGEDDVATADILRIDIDSLVSGTAPVGLQVILEFRLP